MDRQTFENGSTQKWIDTKKMDRHRFLLWIDRPLKMDRHKKWIDTEKMDRHRFLLWIDRLLKMDRFFLWIVFLVIGRFFVS